MPAPVYSYQSVAQGAGVYPGNPTEFQPSANVHAERQQNIDARLAADVRNQGYTGVNQFAGKQQAEWQRPGFNVQV